MREKNHQTQKIHQTASKNSAPKIFAFILICFFLSGLTGLIYEILWTRMIVKIIGGAPFAVSIVLTVFMGGLGLGSYIAARTIDRYKEPMKLIKLYGLLELAIGVYGIILPLLLVIFKPLYAIIYNHLFGYFLGYNLITFAGCVFLLIIPVTCMGTTLPILSRFFITTISRVGTHVGRLYGLNTIGAAAGSLLCGFWLITYIGVWGSLVFAVVLNMIIGGSCLLISRIMVRRGSLPELLTEATTLSREKEQVPAAAPANAFKFSTYALMIFAVSGFCAMAYEVIWTKLLSLIVGPTTYSFTIVLVTFILGLALGSMIFGWLGDRVKDVLFLLFITQLAAALFALLLSQIMGNSQIFFAKLIYHYKDNFAHLTFLKTALLFTFMFFPTICLGATFPLVGKIYTRSLSHTGRSIGSAYAINSVGAILGSFCAGFILIPLLGKEQGLRLVVLLQILTTLVLGGHLLIKVKGTVSKWFTLTLPGVLGLALLVPFPHWDRKMLSIGRYHHFDKPEIRDVGWFGALFSWGELFSEYTGGDIVYFGDGIGGFITVLKSDLDILGHKGFAIYSSGKAEASSRLDMDTQTLSAHLPMLFHKNPKKVLVIGLASGITAGEMLHYPIERLDVVDINRQMVQASWFFVPWNGNVLSNPKTDLIIQDARAHLELSDRTYDVISSEPSNPWMAGLANLFSREFFSLVRAKLKDDGIFVQFIHTYQMDWPTFALVGRTFSQVFPDSLLVRTNPSSLGPDFLLMGFKGQKGLDEKTASHNVRYARLSKNVPIRNHRLFYHLIVSEDLKKLFGRGAVHTDNIPLLEFSAPKLLHVQDNMIGDRLLANRWLREETVNIIKEDSKNIDAGIDFAEYALAVIRPEIPFQNPVDLSMATAPQKDRFLRLMDRFCGTNIVTDFSQLGDLNVKERCISAQIKAARHRLLSKSDQAPLHLHLGALYAEIGMTDEALAHFQSALRIDPSNAEVHFDLALFLSKQGRTGEAIEHYLKALGLKPNHTDALNNLAWLLATSPNPEHRNGATAVRFARQACELTGNRDPFLMDTLAAAYAEAGHYERAAVIARRAIDLAIPAGYNQLAKEVQKRLELYRSDRPFRSANILPH